MTKRALITGITGQDGSYLADLLLDKDYEVHGMVRPRGEHPPDRRPVRDEVVLHTGDLLDEGSLTRVLSECQPDEVYNLAGTSFVAASWSDPVRAAESTAAAVARLLESVRRVVPDARYYQASSSEIFGLAAAAPRRRMGTSSRSPTASRTTCSRRPGSSTTTSRRAAGSSSSRARSRTGRPPSSSTWRRSWRSAT